MIFIIFKHGLHTIYTCCVHIYILKSINLAVLFVSPSKIALEKCYVYCPPPLLLDEIYAAAKYMQNMQSGGARTGIENCCIRLTLDVDITQEHALKKALLC